MNQGIYRLYGKTGKSYVGKSINLKSRLYAHRYELREGKHKNSYLQSSYNKYGDDFFQYEVLEIVENKELLYEREQFYIDKFDSYHNGYNLMMAIPHRSNWEPKDHRKTASVKIKQWWEQDGHKEQQSARVKARFKENPEAMIKLMSRSTSTEQVEVFKDRMKKWREGCTQEEISAFAKKASQNRTKETWDIANIRQKVAKFRRWLNNQLPKHNHFGFKNIGFTTHKYKGIISTYALCTFVNTEGKKQMKKFSIEKLGLLPAMANACQWRDEIMTPMYLKYIKENENV